MKKRILIFLDSKGVPAVREEKKSVLEVTDGPVSSPNIDVGSGQGRNTAKSYHVPGINDSPGHLHKHLCRGRRSRGARGSARWRMQLERHRRAGAAASTTAVSEIPGALEMGTIRAMILTRTMTTSFDGKSGSSR